MREESMMKFRVCGDFFVMINYRETAETDGSAEEHPAVGARSSASIRRGVP